MTDAEEHVRKEISKTGFPLELEIFSILTSGPWVVTAQDYFHDTDENKSRHIDLAAMNMPNVDKHGNIINQVEPISLNWNLSVECKKSSRNWVFFPVDDYYVDTSGLGINIKISEGPGFGHYDPKKYKIASIYTTLNEGKDEIFEALMQLVKHVSYSKNKIWERTKLLSETRYSINFWFPIIVLDGKMWNVFTKNGQIAEIVESKHTILKMQYGSSNVEEEGFAIDVVQKSYFGELMNIIINDMKSYEKLTKKDKTFLMKTLDEDFLERTALKHGNIF